MSSREDVPISYQFQLKLTIEEWMATEFERVTIQYEELLDVIDHVRFFGVNGLIQRENRKVSPFSFQLISEKGEKFLVIAFSIPIFQSLDSMALQTGMEYFASVLKFTLCREKPVHESEVMAFDDIKRLPPIHYQNQEIIPYEDFTEKIEVQLKMKVRMGLQIIPISSIDEKIRAEKMGHLKELRKVKRSLANIRSNLREYSQHITQKYRINVENYLFQTSLESRFEPSYIPIFSLNSSNQFIELFSLLILTEEVINRISDRELEIMLAHEIIFDMLKNKFSRGILEREIFQILSEDGKNDPEYLIEKEMSKFFDSEEIKEAQRNIKAVVEALLAEGYPVLQLD
ncbi:MAG: hypothetical protein ACFE9L_09800 [Candidatus Hodarchaeota archaeon]